MAAKEVVSSCTLTGRYAAELVKNANEFFKYSVYCSKDGRRVSAKSLLGILSLGVMEGERITFYFYSEEDSKKLDRVLNFN